MPEETAIVSKTIDLSVIVTCYNEEAFVIDALETVIGTLAHLGITYEIIVIDDVSQDHSVLRIREYLRQHPDYPITLKVNDRNRGLASNYVEGTFLTRGKYYHLVAGDNAIPQDILVNIYRHIGKADMIIPYQIQNEVRGKSFGRKRLSEFYTWLVNFISGYRINYYNGQPVHLRYNVMRWHPVSYGFGFQADIVTILLDQGASYLQVYSRSVDRKGAQSTALTMRNILSVCHTLLEITFRRIRRFLYGKDCPKPVEIKLDKKTS